MGHSLGEYTAAGRRGGVLARGRAPPGRRAGPADGGALPARRDGRRARPGRSGWPTGSGRWGGALSLAAFNGPTNTVISGPPEAVAEACERFRDEAVFAQPLAVNRAFHSPLLGPSLGAFERAARTVASTPPRIPLISNLTGAPGRARGRRRLGTGAGTRSSRSGSSTGSAGSTRTGSTCSSRSARPPRSAAWAGPASPTPRPTGSPRSVRVTTTGLRCSTPSGRSRSAGCRSTGSRSTPPTGGTGRPADLPVRAVPILARAAPDARGRRRRPRPRRRSRSTGRPPSRATSTGSAGSPARAGTSPCPAVGRGCLRPASSPRWSSPRRPTSGSIVRRESPAASTRS